MLESQMLRGEGLSDPRVPRALFAANEQHRHDGGEVLQPLLTFQDLVRPDPAGHAAGDHTGVAAIRGAGAVGADVAPAWAGSGSGRVAVAGRPVGRWPLRRKRKSHCSD